MHQTHSNKVVQIKKIIIKKKIVADAMITKMKGIALGVVTADCVPIIFTMLKSCWLYTCWMERCFFGYY